MRTLGNHQDPLACFRCEKQIEREPFTGSLTYGISFTSYGGYGSTVFDACDSRTHLRIDVCDECVRERGGQGAVLEATVIPKAAEVRYEQFQPQQDDVS